MSTEPSEMQKSVLILCGSFETSNEHDSKITFVHGCLPEGGDSILGACICEPLRVKLQDK